MDKRLAITTKNSLPLNQQIKTALESVKIKQATIKEIGLTISDSIDGIIFYLGLNTPLEDINRIKLAVIDDVKQHFPSLTIDEISIALNNGCRGMYGDVIGFAPKDAYIWIYAYVQSQERKEVLAKVVKEEPTNKHTDEQLKVLAWENTVRAWETYKENDYFNDYGNIIYKYLAKAGKINYTDEQRNDFKRLAKANLNSKYNPINSLGNIIKMNEHKHILAEVNSSNENERLISEAKRLALNHFFKELKEMGSEIQDLFIEE